MKAWHGSPGGSCRSIRWRCGRGAARRLPLPPLHRRDVLLAASAALAVGALGPPILRADAADRTRRIPRATRSLRILVLGGTGFLGPHQVRYAVGRGHRVTVFNRGRREAELPEEVERLVGDREGNLAALEGRRWDVVFDNPATLPRWVRDAAAVLKGAVSHYFFVSTVSVYADLGKRGTTEDAPLLAYEGPDPMAETDVTGANYGALKALAEQEAVLAFPGRATVVRPGLLVGPGDPTDRFTYWPARVARGGEVLAPGNPTDPVQFVDARDVAEWTVRLAERRTTGTFNATGPAEPLTMGGMLGILKDALEADASFTWIPARFLAEHGARPWSDLPVWVPPGPGAEGFATISNTRARAAGLTFRPVAETARDTLAWHRTRPEPERERLAAGLDPRREREILEAFRAVGADP